MGLHVIQNVDVCHVEYGLVRDLHLPSQIHHVPTEFSRTLPSWAAMKSQQ